MTVPAVAGCPWPIDPACFEDTWDGLDSDVQARSIILATNTLRRLTAYRVGGCPITVRPCKGGGFGSGLRSYYDMQASYGYGGYWPHIDEYGVWVNSCGCAGDCGCGALCKVALPPPVGGVTQVKVNGSVVDPTTYKVIGNDLVWTGVGTCPWPLRQDVSIPDTEAGTFSVTYLNSYPVDAIGAYALGVLAMEFAKACIVGGKCRLPTGVTNVARQGVSYQIASGAFPEGLTGIREVDTFIALWNPKGRTQATTVYSPDVRSARRVG